MSDDFTRIQWSYPIRQFRIVVPESITDALNALVVDINTNLQLLGASSVPTVTTKQLRLWAASAGAPLYIYQIDNACPSDIANAVNIQWEHGNTMVSGDALYQFIQTTLGFNAAQMAAAMTTMQGYTP